MSILSKLFKSRNTNSSIIEQSENEPHSIEESLFVDQVPPQQNTLNIEPDAIDTFIEKDFKGLGFKAGYHFHSDAVRESDLAMIKSQYKELLRDVATEKRESLEKLRIEIAKLDQTNLKKRYSAALEEKKTQVERSLLSIEEEILLISDTTGRIEKPISTYEQGFTEGYELYLEEKLFTD